MTKLKPIVLRPHEARRLAECGEVLVARAVKPQPTSWHGRIEVEVDEEEGFANVEAVSPGMASRWTIRCPFGQVGERRWVRETAELQSICGWNVPGAESELRYKGGGVQKFKRPNALPYDFSKAIGAACMPRWASRFTVEAASIACRQPTTEDKATIAGVEDGVWYWLAVMRRVEG